MLSPAAAKGISMVEPARLFVRHPPSASSARFASPTSVGLNNLRGIVILIVLGFHSALAYVSWVKAPTVDFDSPPYAWRAFPIVDDHRFFGFDLFCAWQDVYLMSLMFFLSGLFVWPSLLRKTEWTFVRDRLLRLGIPYAFGVAVIIPIAIYPAYAVTTVDPSLAAYWDALRALPFWPNGPLWFLWQLLVLNVIAALVYWIAPNALPLLGRWSMMVRTRFGL
jgi:glucans biosynthesis protein C